ncbi:putative odorant receptor 69a isoform X7 [Drosophila takahashii]|uniref:putative odorant receptor 69a isoform X7 n=1 Tax=Drosophila takahashii TaxID=29030 RepID=UPI0038994D64
MPLIQYMKYLDRACTIGFAPRFQWIGGPTDRDQQTMICKIIFKLAVVLLVYQVFGIITYWFLTGWTEKDTVKFITEVSEMCGSLMLIIVACTNVYGNTKNRPNIQELFAELQAIYPKPKDNHFRTQHYQNVALFTMKCQYILYVFFYMYYNGAPLLLLLWEFLMDKQNMSYRTQTNMWFPWKVHGSPIGFGVAILAQALDSLVGVAFAVKTLNIITISLFQLKLHFDALASQLLHLDSRHPGSYRKLKNLIAYHCRILEIGELVNEILNYNFLSSLIGSTIAICMTSVAILLLDVASAFKYISGLVAFALYHFFICYMGTTVAYASDKVLPAAFYNNWYEGDLAYRKMLLILMMRATKPYIWRTYKLAPVSITTYMATLKFSYQMFTCVRSLK